MKNATLDQAAKILSIFKGVSVEQIQAIIESGLLADLSDGNIPEVDRDEFRKILKLPSFYSKIPGRLFTTVICGEYPSVEELRQGILKSGKEIKNLSLLTQVAISKEMHDIMVREVSVAELGLYKKSSAREIFERAIIKFNFGELSLEAALLALIKSPCGKSIVCGSHAVDRCSLGEKAGPHSNLTGLLCLNGKEIYINTDGMYEPEEIFLFDSPKS